MAQPPARQREPLPRKPRVCSVPQPSLTNPQSARSCASCPPHRATASCFSRTRTRTRCRATSTGAPRTPGRPIRYRPSFRPSQHPRRSASRRTHTAIRGTPATSPRRRYTPPASLVRRRIANRPSSGNGTRTAPSAGTGGERASGTRSPASDGCSLRTRPSSELATAAAGGSSPQSGRGTAG